MATGSDAAGSSFSPGESPGGVAPAAAGAPEDRFACEVYRSWEDVEPVKEEWDDLGIRSGGDIYSSYEWCRTWWRFFGRGRRLEIRAVRRDERLIAVFPIFRETLFHAGLPVRLVRLLGCDSNGLTSNVVVERGMEEPAVAAVARSLEERPFSDWDAVHLGLFPGYADNVRSLAAAFEKHLPGARVSYSGDIGPYTVFNLPGDFETYIGRLSKNMRKSIRKSQNGLASEHESATVTVTEGSEVMEAFSRFRELHGRYWRGRGQQGHFGDWPCAREFHESLIAELARKKRVLMSEFRIDGDLAVSRYGFLFGKRAHFFLSAREDKPDWRSGSPSRLHFLNLVEYAIENGIEAVDSMRGYFQHKVRLGGSVGSLQAISIVRRGTSARLRVKWFRAVAWMIHTLYYRVWFARLAPMLRLPRGRLWRLWIRSRVWVEKLGKTKEALKAAVK